jgi:hypothetical protein
VEKRRLARRKPASLLDRAGLFSCCARGAVDRNVAFPGVPPRCQFPTIAGEKIRRPA